MRERLGGRPSRRLLGPARWVALTGRAARGRRLPHRVRRGRRPAAGLVVAGAGAGRCSGRCWPGASATSPAGPRCPPTCFFAWLTVGPGVDRRRRPPPARRAGAARLPRPARAARRGDARPRGTGRRSGAPWSASPAVTPSTCCMHLVSPASLGLRRREAVRPHRAAARLARRRAGASSACSPGSSSAGSWPCVMLVGRRVGLRSHIAYGPSMLRRARFVGTRVEYQLVA